MSLHRSDDSLLATNADSRFVQNQRPPGSPMLLANAPCFAFRLVLCLRCAVCERIQCMLRQLSTDFRDWKRMVDMTYTTPLPTCGPPLVHRLMDYAGVLNSLLSKEASARRRDLRLRTYAVLPLTEDCGLLQWLNNLLPLKMCCEEAYAMEGLYKK